MARRPTPTSRPTSSDEELPSTLRRSGRKARETFRKTLDAAHRTYGGDEARAHRTAFAALKHSFEKVGDHWEPKRKRGPSDPRAASGGPDAEGQTAGGVDVIGHTRAELLERARAVGVKGRARMTKLQLGQAIARRQR